MGRAPDGGRGLGGDGGDIVAKVASGDEHVLCDAGTLVDGDVAQGHGGGDDFCASGANGFALVSGLKARRIGRGGFVRIVVAHGGSWGVSWRLRRIVVWRAGSESCPKLDSPD